MFSRREILLQKIKQWLSLIPGTEIKLKRERESDKREEKVVEEEEEEKVFVEFVI